MNITPKDYPGGKWIEASDVGALTNVAGRCARFESGLETPHWQYANLKDGSVTHWYFAPHQLET